MPDLTRPVAGAAAALVVAALGCAPAPAPPADQPADTTPAAAAPDSAALAAVSDSLRAAYEQAVIAGDAAALAALYAPDAWVMDPDVPTTRGRDSIRAAFERSFRAATFSNMDIEQLEMVPMGDYLLTIGTSIVTVRPRGGQATEERNRWVAVTRRQADGTWKLWRVLSSNAATLRRP
jgi:uncharacterized protein (TIGR02246 family)